MARTLRLILSISPVGLLPAVTLSLIPVDLAMVTLIMVARTAALTPALALMMLAAAPPLSFGGCRQGNGQAQSHYCS